MPFDDCHITICCDCKGANSSPTGLALNVCGAEHPTLLSTCVIVQSSGAVPVSRYIAPAFAINRLLVTPILILTNISAAATTSVSSPKTSPSPESEPEKLLRVPRAETIQLFFLSAWSPNRKVLPCAYKGNV
jgi:hypothetical protein